MSELTAVSRVDENEKEQTEPTNSPKNDEHTKHVQHNEDVDLEHSGDYNNEIMMVKCICGESLQQLSPHSCYDGDDVHCYLCCEAIKDDKIIHHCPEEKTEDHTKGYDLCRECAKFKRRYDLCKESEILEHDDRTVANLSQDMLSMAFALIKNGTGLSGCFICFMLIIYIIQLFSLITLAWGFSLELNRDVIVPYSVEDIVCGEIYNNTNYTNYTICEELKEDSPITISLSELAPRKSEYVDLENFQGGYMHIFGWSSLLSLMLLSIYSISAGANPIAMLVIAEHYAYEEGKAHKKSVRWHRHGNCCAGGKTGLLRILSWVNIILISFAYCIGIVILSGYSLYFGISDPTAIILTPIGIVFILEIDDWAFLAIRNWYGQCNDDEDWSLKASYFEHFDFQNEYKFFTIYVIITWFCLSFFCWCIAVVWAQLYTKEAGVSVENSYHLQSYGVIGAICVGLVLFVCIIMPKKCQQLFCRTCKNNHFTSDERNSKLGFHHIHGKSENNELGTSASDMNAAEQNNSNNEESEIL